MLQRRFQRALVPILLQVQLIAAYLVGKTNSFVPPPRLATLTFTFTRCRCRCRSIETIYIYSTCSRLKLKSTFLSQVEDTIRKVEANHPASKITDIHNHIHNLPPSERESVGVAKRLSQRIHSLHKNNDCPACWLQRAHCICSKTPPIEDLVPSNIHRLFMIMHHKEIGLVVDTAKVLLNSMPNRARLIVSGISEEYQESVRELNDALEQRERRCLVLFPTEEAKPFSELYQESMNANTNANANTYAKTKTNESQSNHNAATAKVIAAQSCEKFDLIVMDGTWQQARKIHQRYIPLQKDGGPQRVCLSQESLDVLGNASLNVNVDVNVDTADIDSHTVHEDIQSQSNGRQLRRHPIKWKEVSTLEATRLLFRDMMVTMDIDVTNQAAGKQCHDILAEYQRTSDKAAVRQLGPPRQKLSLSKN